MYVYTPVRAKISGVGPSTKAGKYLMALQDLVAKGVTDLSNDNFMKKVPSLSHLFATGHVKFVKTLRDAGIITPVGTPVALTSFGRAYVV